MAKPVYNVVRIGDRFGVERRVNGTVMYLSAIVRPERVGRWQEHIAKACVTILEGGGYPEGEWLEWPSNAIPMRTPKTMLHAHRDSLANSMFHALA